MTLGFDFMVTPVIHGKVLSISPIVGHPKIIFFIIYLPSCCSNIYYMFFYRTQKMIFFEVFLTLSPIDFHRMDTKSLRHSPKYQIFNDMREYRWLLNIFGGEPPHYKQIPKYTNRCMWMIETTESWFCVLLLCSTERNSSPFPRRVSGDGGQPE